MAKRWIPDEDVLLERLHAAGESRSEIATRLGRSEYAIDARRRALGISALPRVRPWSEREDGILRAAAEARIPAFELAARHSRRVDAIWRRRRRLGIAKDGSRPYSAAENEAVRRAFAEGKDVADIAQALGRTHAAIALRLRELQLVTPRSRRRWLAEEDTIVRRGYEDGFTCAAIGALLAPPRTAAAVAAHARVLGITNYGRRWTEADDRRLRALLTARASVEDAAQTLVRTPEGIRQRARTLGLKVAPAYRARAHERWDERDDALLRSHASAGEAALALLLGRSDVSVRRRLVTLGLRPVKERTPHRAAVAPTEMTPAALDLVRREFAAGGVRRLFALARRFDHTPADLRRIVAPGEPPPPSASGDHS